MLIYRGTFSGSFRISCFTLPPLREFKDSIAIYCENVHSEAYWKKHDIRWLLSLSTGTKTSLQMESLKQQFKYKDYVQYSWLHERFLAFSDLVLMRITTWLYLTLFLPETDARFLCDFRIEIALFKYYLNKYLKLFQSNDVADNWCNLNDIESWTLTNLFLTKETGRLREREYSLEFVRYIIHHNI